MRILDTDFCIIRPLNVKRSLLATFLICLVIEPPSLAFGAEQGKSIFTAYGLHDLDKHHTMHEISSYLSRSKQKPDLTPIGVLGASTDRINSNNSGTWDNIDNRYLLWRLQLVSKGSAWLDAQFISMKLPRDTTIVVSNPNTNVGWVYSSEELTGKRTLRTAAVIGNEILVEVKIPFKQRNNFYLEIGQSLLGFDFVSPTGTINSGACNVDAICEVGPDWIKPDNVRSVGQYTFISDGLGYSCSGALLASKGNSMTPYFLSAHHCMSTQTEADSMTVYWNYQSPECRITGSDDNGTPLPLTFASHSQDGAQLRATYQPTDFTLLELDNLPPSGANTYYAGWTNSHTIDDITALNGDIYSIHHPAGHEKRISVVFDGLIERSGYYQDTGNGDTHWLVNDWDMGTTEGGSSGAPLFKNRWIIGQLHGGDAACGNNEPDWYGAFDRSYVGGGTPDTQLMWWLQHGEIQGPAPGSTASILQHDGYEGP
jgi:lysyl endopeptidase